MTIDRTLVAALVALAVGCGGSDGGGPSDMPRTLDDCFADLAAPSQSFIEVQSYASADGAYRIRRARQPGGRSSVGETFPYDLIRFGAEAGDEKLCIQDTARLSYAFQHHNWDDTMEAQSATASYRINEKRELSAASSQWTYTLTVLEPGGATRKGPLPLMEAGCRTMPYDYNGCPLRTRTDKP